MQNFESPENLYQWKCTLYGPEDTPYEGGTFHLDVRVRLNFDKSKFLSLRSQQNIPYDRQSLNFGRKSSIQTFFGV